MTKKLESSSKFVILNGELVTSGEAVIPAQSRAVTYGQSCFETLRVDSGFRVFAFQEHIERLMRGAVKLGYKPGLKNDTLSPVKIPGQIRRLLNENKQENDDARVRLQCGRLDTGGIRNREEARFFLLISCEKAPPESKPVRLTVNAIPRISPKTLDPSVKWSFYVPNIEAFAAAESRGFDDALLPGEDGHVCETALANIFFIFGNEIVSPELQSGPLHGITRQMVMRMLFEQGKPVVEEKVSFPDIEKAYGAFITNSVTGIAPVLCIDDVHFPENSRIIKKITDDFRAYRAKHSQTLPE